MIQMAIQSLIPRCRTLLLATALLGPLTTVAALAGTYTPIYQFTGGPDGAAPSFPLAYDEKGNLYGTAYSGADPCGIFNETCGTVFKVSPTGQETTLVTFTGTNGKNPQSPITLINHTLYGSTTFGGAGAYGVLFSVHADGSRFKLLHTFSGPDGTVPWGPLIPGPQGVFYGVTNDGGPHNSHAGVLFELKPDGKYIHLHDFTGGSDGSGPTYTLSIDASGTLYGSTQNGMSCRLYCGVVYRYVPSTGTFTVLHQFVPQEGTYPMVGSVGPDGTLYGVTNSRGPRNDDAGTLFSLTPAIGGAYTLTTLYAFRDVYPYVGAGFNPSGGPVLTAYGALIGTTLQGNESLYKFKSNHMSVLYSFPSGSNAQSPTLDKNGTIYGAASQAGAPCTIGACGFLYSFLRPAP